MVVGLKPSQPKPEPGDEKEQKWKDWIPISIPVERRKKVGGGFVVIVIMLALVVAAVCAVAISGHYASQGSGKKAKIYSEGKDWKKTYKNRKVHGRCGCWDYEAGDTYEDWYELLQGDEAAFEEYIVENAEGVYSMEVKAWCDAPKTYLVVDLNKGYTAMKLKPKGVDYHCVLIDNSAFLDDLDAKSVSQFNYSSLDQEFSLPIRNIISHFFEYGEPVPAFEREPLGEFVNALCPDGTLFYYMISGDATFRAQVQSLMDAHDIEYDDIFYSFVDVYDALDPVSADELREVTRTYLENVMFLPTGYYGAHTSPSGVGWSLNIKTDPLYKIFTFGWNGTLTPPVDEVE